MLYVIPPVSHIAFIFFHLAFWMVFWLESKIWHKWTFYKTKQIPRHRTDLRLWGGGRGREGLARLGLADANCYIRDGWTIRHRELCSGSCDDPQWKRTYICISESPCRTAEINHNIVNQPYLNKLIKNNSNIGFCCCLPTDMGLLLRCLIPIIREVQTG